MKKPAFLTPFGIVPGRELFWCAKEYRGNDASDYAAPSARSLFSCTGFKQLYGSASTMGSSFSLCGGKQLSTQFVEKLACGFFFNRVPKPPEG